MSSQTSFITNPLSSLKQQQNDNATDDDLDQRSRNGSVFYISQSTSDVTPSENVVMNKTQPESLPHCIDNEGEKILPDVIYAIESLMAKNQEWTIPNGITTIGSGCFDENNPGAGSSVVSLDEVLKNLGEAFSADEQYLQKLRQEAKQRQVVQLRLNLTVGEADIQTQRDAKKQTNSFIRVIKGPKFKEEFKTPKIMGTLNPKWKHSIETCFTDLKSDCIHLELWHETEEEKKKKRHFIKGSVPESPKYVLLAELILKAKDILAQGITGWYDMENRFGENMKAPTRVRLLGCISCACSVECDALQNYEILLKYLLANERKKSPQEEKIGPCSNIKSIVLMPSSRAALRQFAMFLNLSQASQCLSWWNNVTILLSPIDWQMLYTQFNKIKVSLVVGTYSATEQERLSQSVSDVIDRCIACVKNMEKCFPASHPKQSKTQLSFMLQTMKSIQTHPRIRVLLREDNNFCLRSVIKAALLGFSRQWINEIFDKLSPQRSGSKKDQLQSALVLTNEVIRLFQNLCEFYDNIFMEEYDVCCLKACYPVIVKEMMENLEPVVMECCYSIPKSVGEIGEDGIAFDFLIGSSIMKIYKNIAHIWRLRCPHLSSAIVDDTGIQLFNSYFEDGIENQLSLTEDREQVYIDEVILSDNLVHISPNFHFSSSLKEARAIPHRFKIWWFELVWPKQEDRATFLMKVLRSLFFLSIYYCQALSKRAGDVLKESGDDDREIVNEKICVVITNMVSIMNDMKDYHDILGFKFLAPETKEKFSTEIEAMVNISTLNVQNIMQNFTWKVINMKEEFLEQTLMKDCQTDDSVTFLTKVLYPTIDVLRKFLEVSNSKIILEILWIKIVRIAKGIVDRECKMEPEFYGRLLTTLQKIFMDLTPDSGEALDPQSANTEEHKCLIEDLELMKKNSSSLINLYYKMQYEEEQRAQIASATASLVIRTWFQENSMLHVDVIMAKDIVVPPEEIHKAPLEYYIKVEVIASESQYTSEKTQVLKEDPATFDKLLKFDLQQSFEDGHEGSLILTLKDRNLTRADTFLGESAIPFISIPQGESYARNRYLNMFLPHVSEGRKRILQILEKRDTDKTATTFLKMQRKRHSDIAEIIKSFKH